MTNNYEKIAELILKYKTDELTEQERAELEEWLKGPGNRGYFNHILQDELIWDTTVSAEPDKESIWEKINAAGVTQRPVVSIKRRSIWQRIAVAASLFFVVGIGGWLIWNSSAKGDAEKKIARIIENDVLPGSDKAVLTLADGKTINLNDIPDGTIAKQGSAAINKTEGSLSYAGKDISEVKEIFFNTLSTPRGGQFKLVLPDGSRVWLNAASSIRFPSEFRGNVRKVEVTGEAYFEVVKNPAMPFIVTAKEQDVTVLGTRFNVNAYDDESAIRTTLMEGSVKLDNNTQPEGTSKNIILKPGEQSIFKVNGNISVTKDINLDQQVAWMKGYFHFKNQDVESIMRQVARWYDVEVVYVGHKPAGGYTGKISRDTKATVVLKLLQEGGIQYKIEGKKILISE